VPLSPWEIRAVAVASIAALTALNCVGVRAGVVTQNVLTILKTALLIGLIVVAFAVPGGGPGHFHPFWIPGGSAVAGFALATVAVLWTFDGWIEITYVGGEVRDPGRVVPRSIILATLLAAALYLVVTLAFLYVLSPAGTAASALPASDAARATLGPLGAGLVAIAIMISAFGANNGIILTSARIPFAMAREGRFLRSVGALHPRWGTPVTSLVHQGVIASALTLTGTYDQLITYVVFASWIFYALGALSVMRLRRSAPGLDRPYRTWGYPFTPVVFILFALALVAATVVETPREAGVGMVLILAGLVPYRFWSRRTAAA
jgi:APA family basic amino acid/polyamine antiporter